MLQTSMLVKDKLKFRQDCSWSEILHSYNILFSPFRDHDLAIQYTRKSLPFIVRKRLCQLRLGCLPLKIHTDRFKKEIIPPDKRFCTQSKCDKNIVVENELHFLCTCKQYTALRTTLYSKIEIPGFINFPKVEQFRYLLTTSSISNIVGQFIVDAFDIREK